jgi:hypothetical protein
MLGRAWLPVACSTIESAIVFMPNDVEKPVSTPILDFEISL